MADDGYKLIAQNKKARHDYFIEDTYEAGIVLSGTEVKSLRQGKANLKDSYVIIRNNEAFVTGLHISPYEMGNIYNKDPDRMRKLLLHKYEINKLIGKTQQEGLTLVPTKLYFKNSKAKIEVAIAKGKKLYDKRHDIAKRDANRRMDKVMKSFNR